MAIDFLVFLVGLSASMVGFGYLLMCDFNKFDWVAGMAVILLGSTVMLVSSNI